MSMMPEDDDMDRMIDMMPEDEVDIGIQDYSHISKHPYISKVFCWIESGETQEVKNFFETFPHLLHNFHSPNNWNPLLYAVRYGNFDLIDYFAEKNMSGSISGILNTISIVHTAVYSKDLEVLEYIFKKFPVVANPPNCEISPLKAAIKSTNGKMVEFLISRGAFYAFGDVYNNIETKQNVEQSHKYIQLGTGKEVSANMVVEQGTIIDCPIKEVLKYARVKNVMAMRKLARKTGPKSKKFENLAEILCNDDYFNTMVRTAVNTGDSILKKGNANDHHSD